MHWNFEQIISKEIKGPFLKASKKIYKDGGTNRKKRKKNAKRQQEDGVHSHSYWDVRSLFSGFRYLSKTSFDGAAEE